MQLKSQVYGHADDGPADAIGGLGYYFGDAPEPSKHWSYLAALDDLGKAVDRARIWEHPSQENLLLRGGRSLQALTRVSDLNRVFRKLRDSEISPMSRSLLPISFLCGAWTDLATECSALGARKASLDGPVNRSKKSHTDFPKSNGIEVVEFGLLRGPGVERKGEPIVDEIISSLLEFLEEVLDPEVRFWIQCNGTPLYDSFLRGMRAGNLELHAYFPVEFLVVVSAISPELEFGVFNSDGMELSLKRGSAQNGLRRAYLFNVASAQSCVRQLKKFHVEVPILSRGQLSIPECIPSIDFGGFWSQTPLWFYTLCERKISDDGVKLGPLASQILGQTLYGVLKHKMGVDVENRMM